MNQTAILRKLTGEERLEQAFLMSYFILDLAKQNIKKQLGKNASNKRVIKELQKRLRY